VRKMKLDRNRVKEIREKLMMSRTELARKAEVSQLPFIKLSKERAAEYVDKPICQVEINRIIRVVSTNIETVEKP